MAVRLAVCQQQPKQGTRLMVGTHLQAVAQKSPQAQHLIAAQPSMRNLHLTLMLYTFTQYQAVQQQHHYINQSIAHMAQLTHKHCQQQQGTLSKVGLTMLMAQAQQKQALAMKQQQMVAW